MGENRRAEREGLDRRGFLTVGAAAVGGAAVTGLARGAVPPPLPSNPATPRAMPMRNLGRTGYSVGLFSLGGQAAVEKPANEETAVAIVEKALDLGVNYIDTAARYGGDARWSQKYIGQVMKRRRSETFLASKTHDRTRDGSLRLLEESLTLLNTDHLDLWQLHNITKTQDLDQIFAPTGAIKAMEEAREQGLVRFLGITGHADPDVLIDGIQRFPFDTILLALNAADRHHLSFIDKLLPLAVEKEMGIIGMKIPARGRLLTSWAPPATGDLAATVPGTLDMQQALRYVLTLPVSTVIIGCDSPAQVEENGRLARSFNPLSPAQLATLEERARPVQKQALFFRPWA